MFSAASYQARRAQLKHQIGSGICLFLGNQEIGMNYPANPYHFRQDSHFLYFFGLDQPGLAAIIDIDEDREIVFGDDISLEDVVWMGQQPKLRSLCEAVGVHSVLPLKKLAGQLKQARKKGATIHFLPPYRDANKLIIKDLLNIPIARQREKASVAFIQAVVAQRSVKSEEELRQLDAAVDITARMHVHAMREAHVGQLESDLAGRVTGIAVSGGGNLSYPVILSQNGQILHNHSHRLQLESGRMVLGDFGAENAMHYAGDITRTFPVNAKFSPIQTDLYEIVLMAEINAISSLRPGITYQSVHMAAALQMAEGLKSIGIMKGDMEEAVQLGAHALFFPHGLGHMIGLDVHDMEDLGEEYVGYDDTVKRSTQFGTAYLRLARTLQPGFVLTVEPGLYFIPELIEQWRRKKQFEDFINYPALKRYKNFGGIRIEDNVCITENGHRILGAPIPKTISEVERLRG